MSGASQENKKAWIDITLPLQPDMPVLPPGLAERPVPAPRFSRLFDAEKGDKVTMSRLEMSSHDGTHIDAPLHFFFRGSPIDKMPADTGIGPARVIEIYDKVSINIGEISHYDIQPGERLLFKTRNSSWLQKKKTYPEDYVYFTAEAALFLATKKVRLVGLDYLTIGDVKSPGNIRETHEIFLGSGIYVLEGLNLSRVRPGRYELVCLSLRLENGDAAPCRAFIRPLA